MDTLNTGSGDLVGGGKMALPPGRLAEVLLAGFPQFLNCDASEEDALVGFLNPMSNPDIADLVQWLQTHAAVADAVNAALQPDGEPGSTAQPLDPELVEAMQPGLGGASEWVACQAGYKQVGWFSSLASLPGTEAVQPNTGAWTLSGLSPVGGLQAAQIEFDPASRSFTLSLVNALPRHLSVYARFEKKGVVISPDGWVSNLPDSAPSGLETETAKYLGVLWPNAGPAGLGVATDPQELTVALPANADSVSLLFGGMNANGFSPIPDVIGALVTAVLDIFVPSLVINAKKSTAAASWYRDIVRDQSTINGLIEASGTLVNADSGVAGLMKALATNLTAILLCDSTRGFRRSVAKALGKVDGQDYDWLALRAPIAGWPYQMAAPAMISATMPQFWPSNVPASLTQSLSPASMIALDAQVSPDPANGAWPFEGDRWTASITYGAGFTQTLSGQLESLPDGQRVNPVFGAVRDGSGPLLFEFAVEAETGAVVAQAHASVIRTQPAGSRLVTVEIQARNAPRQIDETSQYTQKARLQYSGGAYTWDEAAPRPDAMSLPTGQAGVPSLGACVQLTYGAGHQALGCVWQVHHQSESACGDSSTLTDPYFMQNIGAVTAGAGLRTIACGFAEAPLLAYADRLGGDEVQSRGAFLDNRTAKPQLRPINFGTGQFETETGLSIGCFAANSQISGLVWHPSGYVAAISESNDTLLVLNPAERGGADANAPIARAFGGSGARQGLLKQPVALASAPGQSVYVLEQGNYRVQAFDGWGNLVPVFGGQPVLDLDAAPQTQLLDIAVSGAGLIYILGRSGTSPSDCFLDIYAADGGKICRTPGVNAARIALDPAGGLYTLDYDSFTGAGGRLEPGLSLWSSP